MRPFFLAVFTGFAFLLYLPQGAFYAGRGVVRHFLLPRRIKQMIRSTKPSDELTLGYNLAPLLVHAYTLDYVLFLYAEKIKKGDKDPITQGVCQWLNEHVASRKLDA